MDKRRAGPGPEEGRARPRLEDPEDCLLVLMMSSKAISKAVVMFVERKRERDSDLRDLDRNQRQEESNEDLGLDRQWGRHADTEGSFFTRFYYYLISTTLGLCPFITLWTLLCYQTI